MVRIPAKWNTRSGRSGTPVAEQAEQSERKPPIQPRVSATEERGKVAT